MVAMTRWIWPVVFVFSAPMALVAAFLMLFSLNVEMVNPPEAQEEVKVLAAYDEVEELPAISASVYSEDARPLILKKYLKQHNSPLLPHAQLLVDVADKYQLDYRLLVAIARQESNLCKRIPSESNNCWGYGIYGDKVTKFADLPTGIETVAKLLVKYRKSGLRTPEEIMTKYTPPSAEGDGSWARGVNKFLSELE
jgi:hypothetical protein